MDFGVRFWPFKAFGPYGINISLYWGLKMGLSGLNQNGSRTEDGIGPKLTFRIAALPLVALILTVCAAPQAWADPPQFDSVPSLVRTLHYPDLEIVGVAWHLEQLWAVDLSGVISQVDLVTGTIDTATTTGKSTHNGLGSLDSTLYMSYDPGGGTVFEGVIPAGPTFPTPSAGVRDLASDNDVLWFSGINTTFNLGFIGEMSTTGTLGSFFPSPFGFDAYGLAWDSEHLLHMSKDGDLLHLIDPDTGATDFTIDLSPLGVKARGLAWDGNFLYLADLDTIHVVDFTVPYSVLTTFEDDFEDPFFSERNWTTAIDYDEQDERWTVTPGGQHRGDAIVSGFPTSPDGGTNATPNRLGCGAIQEGPHAGVTSYRNSLMSVEFRARAMETLASSTGFFGCFILSDPLHPLDFPGVFYGVVRFAPENFVLFIALFNGLNSMDIPRGMSPFLAIEGLPTDFNPFQWHSFSVELEHNVATVTLDEDSPTSVQASAYIPPLEDGSRLLQGSASLAVGGGSIIEFDDFAITGEEIVPMNTPVGTSVEVELSNNITVVYDTVTQAGATSVMNTDVSPSGDSPSAAFSFLGEFYDFCTNAVFEGDITIYINYDDSELSAFQELRLAVLRFDAAKQNWKDATRRPVDRENNVITAVVSEFSTISVAVPSFDLPISLPIGDGTSAEFPAGPYKRGRTIPIKFRVEDNIGQLIDDELADSLTTYFKVTKIGSTAVGVPEEIPEEIADIGSVFRYDPAGNLFIFNLSTKSSEFEADHVYRVEIIIDGIQSGEIYFSLR